MRLMASAMSVPSGRLVLLAPSICHVPVETFEHVRIDSEGHERLMAKVQRLRGSTYLEDGALSTSSLSADGRHRLRIDDQSWHLMIQEDDGSISGCARFLPHRNTKSFCDLSLSESPMARSPLWRDHFRRAVEAGFTKARAKRFSYVEVGGWALAAYRRSTVAALQVVSGIYALAEILGGALMLASATTRHNSASILKRIGARRLIIDGTELPPYFDDQYACEMEMLEFDSSMPAPRFRPWVEGMSDVLSKVTVLCGNAEFDTGSFPKVAAASDWKRRYVPFSSTVATPATL